MQNSLFNDSDELADLSPLAHKLRPKNREDFIGISNLEYKYPFLKSELPKSMILYGPPGSGKTTLAHVLCSGDKIEFLPFSAVLSGIGELKILFQTASEAISMHQRTPVIFIDEIHRFNKAQQDALLPHVESGKFILIGATTENPRSSINKALLSRLRTVELKAVDFHDTIRILTIAIDNLEFDFSEDEIELMAEFSGGDARKAIGNLELAAGLKDVNQFSLEHFKKLILENSRSYDRNKDRHYDVVSAFIKSMRGSDPDSALLWLAVMLDGGEDPVFIARRLVIFASEDVGNADINGLTIANNALHAVSNIGMPEARITLAQATTYLASTVKSNAAYTAIDDALEYVKSNTTIEVPEHLKNFPAKNHPTKYQYPHSTDEGWVEQQYSPSETPQFYKPKNIGVEKNIRNRLSQLWRKCKIYD
ncbi:MAG: replication-associated recombination protein A [Candidatus Thiodiazotropha sp. (ex. Lucinisca nassula)]|nr:replication-associated recombination protein A [Candidatus Thiodiazotropha sp. (ex. Lucinisca nassula)]MBW9273865.1 replication-associated recombination protein A [Candidatus Thiodiazotropha sp. (ex. Lucinisca nassula)]